jgi:superfamily I DNA/RNA helicase
MPNFRFNLPTLAQLTPTQQIALMSNEPILVTGGPGSGKTVVSVRRLLRLKQANQKVKLFTFNRTLMSAIRGLARSENFESSIVDSFYDWYYSNTNGIFAKDNAVIISNRFRQYATQNGGKFAELLLDESQDFEHKIIQSLSELGERVSCGADRDQDIRQIYANNAEEQIGSILSAYQSTQEHLLEQNFRNTREIFAFARKFVSNNPRPNGININSLPVGDKPEIFDDLNRQEQLAKIKEIVELNQENANIGILVHFKSQVDIIRNFLSEENLVHSYYYQGMNRQDQSSTENDLQTPLIATFASCKGLEFDIVILPLFESVDWSMENGHTTANHYYVAATRARRQLFVFYENKPTILGNFDSELFKLNGIDQLFDF